MKHNPKEKEPAIGGDNMTTEKDEKQPVTYGEMKGIIGNLPPARLNEILAKTPYDGLGDALARIRDEGDK